MKALATRMWAEHNQLIIAVIVTAVLLFFVFALVMALAHNSIIWLAVAVVVAWLLWKAT